MITDNNPKKITNPINGMIQDQDMDVATKKAAVLAEKAAVLAELAAIEEDERRFKEEEEERLKGQRQAVERRIAGLRSDARNLRQKAIVAKAKGLIADEKLFGDSAIDKDWEAAHLAQEWEIAETELATDEAQEISPKGVLATVLKITSVLALCGWAVLASGDWIEGKYPGAAIYNEVSFQKILFGFSVFVTGFVSVIMGMNAFFPGFGRYLNPFNHHGLDFFEDFKTLSEWQRNIISLALFAVLFLGFLWIATGKLD